MTIDLERLTAEMDALKDQEARLKFELKNIDQQIQRVEGQLQGFLEQNQISTADFNGYTFGWREITSKRFNQKKFGEEHPELLEKYKLPITSKRFEFKICK